MESHKSASEVRDEINERISDLSLKKSAAEYKEEALKLFKA